MKLKLIYIILGVVIIIGLNQYQVKANNDKLYTYEFDFYEYGVPQNDVSRFAWKETSSYIQVNHRSSSHPYKVYAMGAYQELNNGKYYDCSNGNYCLMGKNNDVQWLTNYVYEWGYKAAGLKCVYSGDSLFAARGCFFPDSNRY
ncbi:hypothetical protein [Lachnospira multipara]|uniref:Uncharacterized protein n=1 Tax=Lachnospira multipara TaxID=28051 RepID=A0A1H5SW44_9FIRM|nr:hypothetical protein [Lachnospira multipara]SEF54786.1 hypothetical protein SAMN05216537_103166 [Lachnospira multipara]